MTDDRIRDFLSELNACWPRGDLDALAAFYHPDVVLMPPDLGAPILGREAVVASYEEFLDAATLERFDVTALDTFSFTGAHDPGAVHMAHLTFEIHYRLDSERYLEKGLEIYALMETAQGLRIVWRQQTVLDSRLAEKSETC